MPVSTLVTVEMSNGNPLGRPTPSSGGNVDLPVVQKGSGSYLLRL